MTPPPTTTTRARSGKAGSGMLRLYVPAGSHHQTAASSAAVPGAGEAQLGRAGRGVAPGGRAELVEHGGDVAVDRADGDDELAGDLGVRVAPADQAQHVDLARGQAGRVGPRLDQRPARDPGHAELAQP